MSYEFMAVFGAYFPKLSSVIYRVYVKVHTLICVSSIRNLHVLTVLWLDSCNLLSDGLCH